MATQRILSGSALISFDDTLCTLVPSNDNGIQSLTIIRNSGSVLICQAWSGVLAHFPVGVTGVVAVGQLTQVTVS
jgi:hypothetical protein